MSGESTYRPRRGRRIVNAMMGRMLRRGKGPDFLWLLTTTGRSSGQPRTTPVAPVRQDGRVWLVCPYGPVAWVRNLRARGRLELRRGDDHEVYDARELPAAEAVPVLRAYLSMPSARFVKDDFDVTAASADDAIEAVAPRHPVFALTPAGGTGDPASPASPAAPAP